MEKRVKKSTRNNDFDFTIYNLILNGSYPTKIAKQLGMSKQRVDYYISSLKSRDLVEKIGQGAWKVINSYSQKESRKNSRVTKKRIAQDFDSFDEDTIRGHAFQFRFEIPNDLKNWIGKNREKMLNEAGIRSKKLTHLFGGGEGFIFKEKKVHLTNKSIIIYDKASYFAETSTKSQSTALIKILNIIKSLEKELHANFSTNGKYRLKVTRQHYALIKNALAKIYNKPVKTKLEVYDKDGLWLLIDNSWNLEELECVHPETSVENAEGMKGWMNSMKATDFKVTPDFVLKAIYGVTENQKVFDQNMKSHLEVLDNLGKAVNELRKEIKNRSGDKL